MKGPKTPRGSVKSPGLIKRSKSPTESSESIILSTVNTDIKTAF